MADVTNDCIGKSASFTLCRDDDEAGPSGSIID